MAKEKIVDLDIEKELPDVPDDLPDIPKADEPDKPVKTKKAKKKRKGPIKWIGGKIADGYHAVKESPAAALIGAGIATVAAGVAYGIKTIVDARHAGKAEDCEDIEDQEPIEIEDAGESYVDEEPTEDESMDEAV